MQCPHGGASPGLSTLTGSRKFLTAHIDGVLTEVSAYQPLTSWPTDWTAPFSVSSSVTRPMSSIPCSRRRVLLRTLCVIGCITILYQLSVHPGVETLSKGCYSLMSIRQLPPPSPSYLSYPLSSLLSPNSFSLLNFFFNYQANCFFTS